MSTDYLTRSGKMCPRCRKFKLRNGFDKNKARYDGLASWCKPCFKTYQDEWRKRPDVRPRLNSRALARYRGLLCAPCNIALGLLENPRWKAALDIYVRK